MPTIRINICQLKGFCEPFRRRVGECTFFKYFFIGYKLLKFWEYNSAEIVHQKVSNKHYIFYIHIG